MSKFKSWFTKFDSENDLEQESRLSIARKAWYAAIVSKQIQCGFCKLNGINCNTVDHY